MEMEKKKKKICKTPVATFFFIDETAARWLQEKVTEGENLIMVENCSF